MTVYLHKTAYIHHSTQFQGTIQEVDYLPLLEPDDTYVGPGAVIGGFPQIDKYTGEFYPVKIKTGVRIGAGCHISLGSKNPTYIDQYCYIMGGVHIGHDCVIHAGVTLCEKTVLSGHCEVLTGAVLGIGTLVHQFSIIGHYSMVGMGSVITKKSDIFPLGKFAGNPAREIGRNDVGISRHAITTQEELRFIEEFETRKIEMKWRR